MSEKKMIRISPDMFRFATTHKTRKKPPRDPNKPIKIRSERQNNSVKNSKRQLLKYIREQQAQNYKQFSEQSNHTSNNTPISIKPVNDESAEFDSDFNSSLKYLESVAEKAQQSNISNLRHNTTLRHAPSRESLLFGSTLSNVIPYDTVDVNVPDVFSEISPTTSETVQLQPRVSSSSVGPKYGCLKNWALPTYRMWKNQTMKTTIPHTPPPPPPPQRMHGGGNSPTGTTALNNVPNTLPPIHMVNSHELAKQHSVSGGSVIGGIKPKDIISEMRLHEPYRNQQKHRMKRMIKKQKQKRIMRRTFRLGKSKHYPNVSVLVSNKTIRNQTTTRAQLLKQVPIEEIKKTLMKKGLIKVGSTAPTDVLRKMYESVSLMCGDLQNHNPENLLYNYFNAGDQL
jgi:hypothetical protein